MPRYTQHAKHETERPQALRLLTTCEREGVSLAALVHIQKLEPQVLDEFFTCGLIALVFQMVQGERCLFARITEDGRGAVKRPTHPSFRDITTSDKPGMYGIMGYPKPAKR